MLTRREVLKLGAAATAVLGLTEITPARVNEFVTGVERLRLHTDEPLRVATPMASSVTWGGWYPDSNQSHYELFHSRAQIELMYAEFFDPDWKADLARAWSQRGARPLLYIHSRDPRFQLHNLPTYCDYLYKHLVQFSDIEMDIAPFFEPNIPYFRYGQGHNTPEEYVYGFRYVADMVRNTLPKARVWFSPMGNSDLARYFPGDAYIDGVAPHIYNFSSQQMWGPRVFKPNLSFCELARPVFSTIQQLTSKPVLLGEVGIDARNSTAWEWVQEVFTLAPQFGCVGVCWFLQNREGENFGHEANWDVFSSLGGEKFLEVISRNTAYIH